MRFNSKFFLHYKYYLLISLIFIDQLAKHTVSTLMFNDNIGFFKTTNSGAGFSVLTGHNLLLSFITFIFVIYIIYIIYNNKYPTYTLPLIFILAGSLGNLIDRIFFGHVIDFIKIYSWPVFNLADAFLNIGVIWILYYEFFRRRK